jgi:hypothetical protein
MTDINGAYFKVVDDQELIAETLARYAEAKRNIKAFEIKLNARIDKLKAALEESNNEQRIYYLAKCDLIKLNSDIEQWIKIMNYTT